MAAEALDTGQAETIGIVVIVAMVLVGIVVSAIITAIVGRLVVLAVVVLLVAFVWTQRASIASAAKKCDATFLGIHLTPGNAELKRHCQGRGR